MDKYLNKIKSIIEDHGFERGHLDEAVKPGYPSEEANDPTSRDGISNAMASEFFARARALATTTHFAHLSTDSYSEHQALATFYEEVITEVDKFCESYIGLYGKFITLPQIPAEPALAVSAIIEFRDWISKNRSLITDDSSLQNVIDDTVELCNTTIYKLQKLK